MENNDFEKLIEQLKVDDPYYNLSSAERKHLREHIQKMNEMLQEVHDRREAIWVEIESAPPGSPWHQKLSDELVQITKDFMARGDVMLAVVKEAQRKNRELDPNGHWVPEFTATLEDHREGQRVRLEIKKFGHECVLLDWRRNEGEWEMRAITPQATYIDCVELLAANTPETREYRMRFWDKGRANGDWTAVAKVTLGA